MSAVASLASVATRLSRGCVLRRSDPSPVARRLSARRARAPSLATTVAFILASSSVVSLVASLRARRRRPRRASRAAPSSAPPGVSVDVATARRRPRRVEGRARALIFLSPKSEIVRLSPVATTLFFSKTLPFSDERRGAVASPADPRRRRRDALSRPASSARRRRRRARRRRRTSSKKVSPRSSSTTPRRVLPRDHVRSVWNEISPAGKKSHQ